MQLQVKEALSAVRTSITMNAWQATNTVAPHR